MGPGLRTRDTLLPLRKNMRSQPFQDNLSRRMLRRTNAELRRSTSLRERDHQLSTLGTCSKPPTFQRPGTGVTLMEPTIFPGTKTSTSQCTADHAGLRVPPLLLLIDSTSSLETRTQLQLVSTLRLLSTA